MSSGRKKQSASKAMKSAERKFADKIRRYAESHKASAADRSLFKDGLGYGRVCNTLLASDLWVRRKSSKFIGTALERIRSENPILDFYFWTFTHERGHTSDRTPIVDLKYMRGAIDRTLRAQDLNSLTVIEFQGLGNHPGQGAGRTIMTHGHSITWSSASLDYQKVEKQLNDSEHWKSDLGSVPIRIKPITNADRELRYMAYYLFKPPYDVKMVETRTRGDRLKSTEKGYKPDFAARMLELESQLDIRELVRASGDGKYIKSEWLRRLTNLNRSREAWVPGVLPQYYFDDFWARYRVKKKRKHYEPFVIIR